MSVLDQCETSRIEALLAQHLRGPGQRVAAIVYSGTFLLIAVVFNLLWRYAIRRGRVSDATEHSPHVRSITRQYAFGLLLYAGLLLIGIFNATACLCLSALPAVYFALPHGWL